MTEGGGSRVRDIAGRNDAIIANGGAWSRTPRGPAFDFDGTDDRMTAGTVSAISGVRQFTLLMWADRLASNGVVCLGNWNGSYNDLTDFLLWNEGNIYLEIYDGGGFIYGRFSHNVVGLHCYAMVYDGTLSGSDRLKLYIDGHQKTLDFPNGTAGIPSTSTVNTASFEIGRGQASTLGTGLISEAAVWSRALSATELRQLFEKPHLLLATRKRILGKAATAGTQTVSPSAIASAEAFGTATLTPGAVTVSPSGIASAEAFGTATVTGGAITIAPAGIDSAETFGTATISGGAVTLSPSGITSGEAFGTARLTIHVSPSGIASAEGFGTATLTTGPATVSPSGIASAEAFGTPTLTGGASGDDQTASPSGIASAEAFGRPTMAHRKLALDFARPRQVLSAPSAGEARSGDFTLTR